MCIRTFTVKIYWLLIEFAETDKVKGVPLLLLLLHQVENCWIFPASALEILFWRSFLLRWKCGVVDTVETVPRGHGQVQWRGHKYITQRPFRLCWPNVLFHLLEYFIFRQRTWFLTNFFHFDCKFYFYKEQTKRLKCNWILFGVVILIGTHPGLLLKCQPDVLN